MFKNLHYRWMVFSIKSFKMGEITAHPVSKLASLFSHRKSTRRLWVNHTWNQAWKLATTKYQRIESHCHDRFPVLCWSHDKIFVPVIDFHCLSQHWIYWQILSIICPSHTKNTFKYWLKCVFLLYIHTFRSFHR